MKKNKKYLNILLIILFILCLSTGVYAYMFKQTPTLENDFTPASVSCEVDEFTSSSIVIENTGNIDAYIRVKLLSYWVDEEDKIVAKESVMPVIDYDAIKWIKGKDDTYYYTTPLQKGSRTTNLINTPITLSTGGDYKQVIEVFAEAIQSTPTDAVTFSWKVELSGSTITGES